MLGLLLIGGAGVALAYFLSRKPSSKRKRQAEGSEENPSNIPANITRFKTFEEVSEELTRQGLESCSLVIGVDFTKSNKWSGKFSFNGKSLHHLADGQTNPYQSVISIVARSLAHFDDDQMIPVYGFGDLTTTDKHVFSFNAGDQPSKGLSSIEQRYRELVPCITMSGPTSFGPIIRRAIDYADKTDKFHLLIIIADGQVTPGSNEERDTIEAIVEASSYKLSIAVVGVGDGPWDQMEMFDESIPQRSFDNFHFVNYHKVIQQYMYNTSNCLEAIFAMHLLSELPTQYKHTCKQKQSIWFESSPRTRQRPKDPPKPSYSTIPSAPPIRHGPPFVSSNSGYGLPLVQPSAPPMSYGPPFVSSNSGYGPSFVQPSAPPMPGWYQICSICQIKYANTVFQCGHFSCGECSGSVTNCYVCHQHIFSRRPAYN